MWMRYLRFGLALAMGSACALAERSGSHSAPQEPPKTQVKQTPPPTGSTARTSTPPPITRREALIQGMKEIQLNQQALQDIIRVTEENPKLSPQKFNEIVDNLVEVDGTLSKKQAEDLKELFEAELAPVRDAPVGLELNQAAKALLETGGPTVSLPPVGNGKAEETPAKGNPDGKGPADSLKKDDNAGNSALGAITGGIDPQFFDQFSQGLVKGPQSPQQVQAELAKQLAAAQTLLKDIESQRERRRGREDKNGSLLDALRAALGDKNNKDEGNRNPLPEPSSNFGDALKNALTHNPSTGKSRDKGDDDKKFELPKADKGRDDTNRALGNLANLFKNNNNGGNNNGNNQGKNDKGAEGSKFELPEPKVPEPGSGDDKKKPDFSNLLKNDSQEPAVDPAEAAQALNAAMMNQKAAPDLGQKSALPPANPAGGGGNGGGFDPFGGLGGGGGGITGPNIVGSASPPPGGSFDGDPFSGVGNDMGGYGGPGGGFSLSKPVAYGSGGGGDGGGGGNVDGGDAEEVGLGGYGGNAYRPPVSNQPMVLKVAPVDDGNRPLIYYFGKLRKTLCQDIGTPRPAICAKVAGRRALEAARAAVK